MESILLHLIRVLLNRTIPGKSSKSLLFSVKCRFVAGPYRILLMPGRESLLTLSDEPVGELLLNTDFSERAPALSPDGHWLAYESDRSGRYEIYVRPYPDLSTGRWQISRDGGRPPVWSPDARNLYYEAGTSELRQMMAVSLSGDDEFIAGIPEHLFDFRSAFLPGIVRNHDLHPDGDRFLVATPGEQQAQRFIYIENWLDEIERLVPTDP